MNFQMKSLYLTSTIIFFPLMFFWGCATNTPSTRPIEEPPTEKASMAGGKVTSLELPPLAEESSTPLGRALLAPAIIDHQASEPPTPFNENAEDKSETPPDKSDQELLDSALEFCQASYEFWEQGDLDNALDALDQAYALILKVSPDQEPEILQQRDDLRITISKRIVQCYTSRFTVANGYHKAIPLDSNTHVERALKLFKGREKSYFLAAYRRSGRYRPAILKALRDAGLPEELSWLPLIESGFKVRALSRARALGMWQFIASTGYKFGLKRDRWIDERMDPEKSTAAAIAYLKELHQIFGDWTTVLAAYNCGEGRVLKVIRDQRIDYLDNFWDLYRRLPSETAFYVPKFLAVLHILNEPEAHGFALPPVDEALTFEKVNIDKQVHLKTVASALGISYADLKALNPELRHNSTPDGQYEIKVPNNMGQVLLAKLPEIPVWKPPVPAYVIHRVRNGESLSVIARKYRTSVRSIMAMNGLRSSHYLRAGWKLKIPTRKRYTPRRRTYQPVAAHKVEGNMIQYRVRRGDSLWKIANRYGTTTKVIKTANNLYGNRLDIGQILLIPDANASFIKIKSKTYTVLEGDSPYIIANKHQMSLSELLRLNNLTPRCTIFPGQEILVRAE
jgi:membrane-bound lytic murein transglycosylase D